MGNINEIKIITLKFYSDKNFILIEEIKKFDKFKSLSKKGGLKFSFKKPFYISKEKFDSYLIIRFFDYYIMIFTKDFVLDEIIKRYKNFWINNLKIFIENSYKSINDAKISLQLLETNQQNIRLYDEKSCIH